MNESLCVLIVEDDPYILKLCTMFLQDEHYRVLKSTTGKDALASFYAEHPNVILLDLGLPDIDGMDLIQLFRQRDNTPILVISARGEESEKIRALDLGADDYISKPFHTGELMARVRVAQRRLSQPVPAGSDDLFVCGPLRVDFHTEQVFVNGELVHLTPIEYKLLRLLIRNRGKVLTHHYIQTQIWGESDPADAQNLRVFMANLRRKIEGPVPSQRFIMTQVGVGYRFADRSGGDAVLPGSAAMSAEAPRD